MDAVVQETSLEDIRDEMIQRVNEELKSYLDEVNATKRAVIESFITQEAPEYRALGRYINDFIDKVPPGTTGRKLETILHEQMYEQQRQIKRETAEIFDAVSKQSLKPEDYQTKVKDYIERANEIGKSSLAHYVVHRKVMLEFLEKSLEYDAAKDTIRTKKLFTRSFFR